MADKTNPDVFRMACEAAVEYGRCDYPFMEHMVQSQCDGYLSVNGRTCDQTAMAPALRAREKAGWLRHWASMPACAATR